MGVRVDFTPDPDWPQRGPSLSLPASLPGPGAQIAVRGGWGVDLVVPPERTDGHVTCDYYSTDPDENGTVRRTWSFEVVSDEGVESAYDAEDGRVWADISITRSVRTDGRYHETTSFSLAFAEDGSEDPVTAYANDSGDHEVSNGPFSWEFDTTTGIVRATYNTLSRTMSVGDDPGRGQDISIALTVRCPT